MALDKIMNDYLAQASMEKLAISADALTRSLIGSVENLEPYLNMSSKDLADLSGVEAAKILDSLGSTEKNKLKNSTYWGIGHDPRHIPTRVLNDAVYENAASNYIRQHPGKIRKALNSRAIDLESRIISYLDDINKSTGYSLPTDYKLGFLDKIKRKLGIGPSSFPDVTSFVRNNLNEQLLKDMEAKSLIKKSLKPAVESSPKVLKPSLIKNAIKTLLKLTKV